MPPFQSRTLKSFRSRSIAANPLHASFPSQRSPTSAAVPAPTPRFHFNHRLCSRSVSPPARLLASPLQYSPTNRDASTHFLPSSDAANPAPSIPQRSVFFITDPLPLFQSKSCHTSSPPLTTFPHQCSLSSRRIILSYTVRSTHFPMPPTLSNARGSPPGLPVPVDLNLMQLIHCNEPRTQPHLSFTASPLLRDHFVRRPIPCRHPRITRAYHILCGPLQLLHSLANTVLPHQVRSPPLQPLPTCPACSKLFVSTPMQPPRPKAPPLSPAPRLSIAKNNAAYPMPYGQARSSAGVSSAAIHLRRNHFLDLRNQSHAATPVSSGSVDAFQAHCS